ncbi:hypothetical protein NPA07_05330 [Mycoplasmopsis caviae]|uniref:Uncharacterized protein n=1 Tax=Mycoplasmopsis caviae TaxID=55603 RepID=A0A3P8KWY0_9BACT|nr:hypothetical protein [Mycoplasmopsis caviae]UUD35197.1 hypothetical protein NPA07_05330 [Mycoplasmopsis caviae]VDR42007.1 Uncharacterised protein [Mycoplasmopsis caviae]
MNNNKLSEKEEQIKKLAFEHMNKSFQRMKKNLNPIDLEDLIKQAETIVIKAYELTKKDPQKHANEYRDRLFKVSKLLVLTLSHYKDMVYKGICRHLIENEKGESEINDMPLSSYFDAAENISQIEGSVENLKK